MALKGHVKKTIKGFLDKHYRYGEKDGEKVKALDVFAL